MYLEKNFNGDIVIYQSRNKRSQWGIINPKGDYFTSRDCSRGQVFRLFQNSIGLQLEVLEYLENKHPKGRIAVWITNFENEPFYAICPIKDFRNFAIKELGIKAIFSYDKKDYCKYGEQIRLPMNRFTRAYPSNTTLDKFT